MKKKEERQYPRDVWVLTPAYLVRKVRVVKKAYAWSGDDYGDETIGGKRYSVASMHETKQAAIECGRQQIAAREEYLAGQHALLDARRIKLDQAERA